MIGGDVVGGLQNSVPDLFGRLDSRIDRRHDTNEHMLMRLHVVPDDLQDTDPILLACQCNVKTPRLEFEQTGQQLSVVDVGAVRRVEIPAGTSVHTYAAALFGGESREGKIVEIDETVEKIPGRIDLDRETAFGEVDLDLVRALLQAIANLDLVLSQQVLDEFLARVPGNIVRRIHKAQR